MTITSTLLLIGGLTVYDIIVGDDVPSVSNIGHMSRERVMAHYNTTQHLQGKKKLDPEECWVAMQPSLQILDKVCPEASDWVRDRHQKGKIVWEAGNNGYYAKYDYVDKVLTFNSVTFSDIDGLKATVLAHEFRHSRQNFTKFFKVVVACVIYREPHPDIIEDDAYLFEHKVLIAIFL